MTPRLPSAEFGNHGVLDNSRWDDHPRDDHPRDDHHGPAARPGLLGGCVTYLADDTAPVASVQPEDLDDHLRRLGRRPSTAGPGSDRLVDALELHGLTGHGGGHFPTVAKWRRHLAAGGGGVIVANAAEGEPASAKDRALLEFRPHLILDGLACAAEAVGAADVVVWIHRGAHRSLRILHRALGERRAAGLIEPQVRVVGAPDHYLAGESSSIISTLNGGPTLPTFRSGRSAATGVGVGPTLVHNVETLARVGMVARDPVSPGLAGTLLTIGHGDSLSVVDADRGAGLGEVVTGVIGQPGGRLPQALLVGGYGGTWCTWGDLAYTPANREALRGKGVSLGAGIVIPVTAAECGLAQAWRIADYLAGSSAGQCGPCVFGLRSVADLLGDLLSGSPRAKDLARLRLYLGQVAGRGACSHPDGAVGMIASALTTFAADLHSHLRRGVCRHSESTPFVRIAVTS